MSEIILETRQLKKKYGLISTKTALDSVDIALERGHIYGLIGKQDAGKTSLLRIIAGLARASAGSISILGKEKGRELSEARRKIGVLVENPAFYEDLSLQQNMVSQSMAKGKKDREEIKALREKLGIAEGQILNKRIKFCSLDEKQRYGIAAALIGKPEMLVLDEPFGGMSASGAAEVREVLQNMNRESGLTLLVSSYAPAEIYGFATDYIVLCRGKVAEQMTAQELDARIEAARSESGENFKLEKFFESLLERSV